MAPGVAVLLSRGCGITGTAISSVCVPRAGAAGLFSEEGAASCFAAAGSQILNASRPETAAGGNRMGTCSCAVSGLSGTVQEQR